MAISWFDSVIHDEGWALSKPVGGFDSIYSNSNLGTVQAPSTPAEIIGGAKTRSVERGRRMGMRALKTLRPTVVELRARVDDEISPIYDSRKLYPAKPGEVLADQYQIFVEVGWGTSSTVWLARDKQGHISGQGEVVALKITDTSTLGAAHEREIEDRIATADPSHRGRALFRTSAEFFDIEGSNGSYLCLAYQPMREHLSICQARFHDGKIPLPLVKTYIRVLLTGLDYLHTVCKPTHTDLKLENIMVSIEEPAVLGDFMDSQLENTMSYKVDSTGRRVY
ncbi:kinase-like domain-containing protein [Aspergillus varians]